MSSTVLLFMKFIGANVSCEKVSIYLTIGSCLQDLKDIVSHLHPDKSIKRVLFGGKLLKSNTTPLSESGIYKECVILIYVKSLPITALPAPANVCNNILLDEPSERLLEHDSLSDIFDAIEQNTIDLEETRYTNKIGDILRSKQVIQTAYPPSPTLYLDNVNITENELYQYLSDKKITHRIKCILYYTHHHQYTTHKQRMLLVTGYIKFFPLFIPCIIPTIISYDPLPMNAVIVFKSTKMAIHSLLDLAIHSQFSQSLASFVRFGPSLRHNQINIIQPEIENRLMNKDNTWCNVKCYLSKTILPLCLLYSPEGHKWLALKSVLSQYIRKCLALNKLNCIKTRFTVSDVKDILPKQLFEDFSDRMLKFELESKSCYVKCPSCSIEMEIIPHDFCSCTPAEEMNALKKLMHPDTGTRIEIDSDEQKHWVLNRIRCLNKSCSSYNKDFCRSCKHQPYHLGYTCESFKLFAQTPKCRFCQTILTLDNCDNIHSWKVLVCNATGCLENQKISSNKMLRCNHISHGTKWDDEYMDRHRLLIFGYFRNCTNIHIPVDIITECLLFYEISYLLPCLHPNCASSRSGQVTYSVSDRCSLCCDDLGNVPCIMLTCRHIFHFQCVKKKLLLGPHQRITLQFHFLDCPLCSVRMDHPSLKDLIDPWKIKEEKCRKFALKLLKVNGLENDDTICDPESVYYGDPEGLAMHMYSFHQCSQCKEPYYDSQYEPKALINEDELQPLICFACRGLGCNKHGVDHMVQKCKHLKCRYCCTVAQYHFENGLSLCKLCNNDKDRTLYTFEDGGVVTNALLIEEYEQCVGLKDKIDGLMVNDMWKQWSREEKNKQLLVLTACKEQCPLKLEHPPNGFEYGICGLCDTATHDHATAVGDELNAVCD
eukprot:64939_1